MLLFEYNITKKKQMNKNITELNTSNDSKQYKLEGIYNNMVYTRKSVGYLLRLFYLFS